LGEGSSILQTPNGAQDKVQSVPHCRTACGFKRFHSACSSHGDPEHANGAIRRQRAQLLGAAEVIWQLHCSLGDVRGSHPGTLAEVDFEAMSAQDTQQQPKKT